MKEKIPKVIHYCWFGGNPLPPLAEKCIASWRKYLPEYEIKRWDESNFDVNIIPYTSQAYEVRKYAFVSDYARFWILYNYGGLYFDTDVEVINPMNDIIEAGAFMGCEKCFKNGQSPASLGINPGLGFGATAGLCFIKELLEMYATLDFHSSNKTIVEYTTDLLCKKGLINTPNLQEVDGIKIYPIDFFCPKNYVSGKLTITANTRSIHHYDASWTTRSAQIKLIIRHLIGERNFAKLKRMILR